jgi:hypothetical protein
MDILNNSIEGSVVTVDVSRIEDVLMHLRTSICVIALTFNPEDPENCKDVYSEIYPGPMDNMKVFNPDGE